MNVSTAKASGTRRSQVSAIDSENTSKADSGAARPKGKRKSANKASERAR